MAHTEQVKINGIMTTARVFDQPAQAIDDAVSRALPGGAIDQRVSMLCNPNLLDNWYFANPVDQRGGYVVPPGTPYYSDTGLSTQVGTVNAYTKVLPFNGTCGIITVDSTTYYVAWSNAVRGYTGNGYGIDRWFINEHGTLLINDDCISIEGMHRQFIENGVEKFCGKRCCFSVLTKDGELFSGHVIVPTNGTNYFYYANDVLLYSYSDGNTLSVLMETYNGKFIQPIAAKLELGSQQTLAHQDADGNWQLNEIPDYGEQLRRCQRYYINIHQNESLGVICAGTSFGNIQVVAFDIPTPVTIRAKPVIKDVVSYGTLVFADGTQIAVNEILVDCVHASSVRIFIKNTGRSVFEPVSLTDTKFSLSADL